MGINEKYEVDDQIKYNVWNNFYAKFEPIVDKNMDFFSNEILFRLECWWIDHLDFLEKLNSTKSTFWLFKRISLWAFEKSLKTWEKVNINLDVYDIMEEDFLIFIDWLLLFYKINPENINFELLETNFIEDNFSDVFLLKLKILIRIGFGLSIDDLYSWYSNSDRIDYLLQNNIKISTVKIDWTYLRKMFYSHKFLFENVDNEFEFWNFSLQDYLDFENYLKFLQSKDIKLVAEHIESEEIFEFAKNLWFDYFQWNYIIWDQKIHQI